MMTQFHIIQTKQGRYLVLTGTSTFDLMWGFGRVMRRWEVA
jgi:hypothetical protein